MRASRWRHVLCLLLMFAACQLQAGDRSEGIPATRAPVPAGSLDGALAFLARSSRLQIAYPGTLTRNKVSRGAPAGLSPKAALDRLLAGTGLEAVEASPGAFVIRRASPSPQAKPTAKVARQAPVASVQDVGGIEVVGSRLPRQSLESSMPVTLISRQEIESGGYQSLYGLLRVEPGMVGLDPVDVALDGGQGQIPAGAAAAASRSALGPRGTLYLVDGQRIATYPFASPSLGGLSDLDAIPITLVERVEILRGGASSVYGSDAMAGVVNIVLRNDGEGGLSVRHGLSAHGDAQQRRVFVRQSFGGARVSTSVALDYLSRSELPGSRRAWHTFDHRNNGLLDWRTEIGSEQYGGDWLLLPPGVCPPGADGEGRCFLDIPRYQSLRPRQDATTAQIQSGFLADSGIRFFAGLRTGLDQREIQVAPVNFWLGGRPIYPHQDEDIDGTSYAFFDVGPVRARWEGRQISLQAGASGALATGKWNLTASSDRYRLDTQVRGAIALSGLSGALSDGSYVLGAPDNDIAAIHRISPGLSSGSESYQHSLGLGGYTTLFEWDGRPVRASAGLEAREEGLETVPDPLMEKGQILLTGLDAHRTLRRRVLSAYGELAIPATDRLAFDASWRLDKSGGASARLSPKYGFSLDLAPHWQLIGSLGEGFRAPTLYELRKPLDRVRITSLPAADTLANCASMTGTFCILDVVPAENAALGPETSRSRLAGVAWTPVAGLRVDASYFDIVRRNEIRATVVADAYTYPEILIRNGRGEITGVHKTYVNEGRTEVAGWEWGAAYSRRVGSGDLDVKARGASTVRLDRSSEDYTPRPRNTALALLDWTRGDWQYRLDARHVGSSAAWSTRDPCPAYRQEAGKCHNPAFTTFGVGLAYAGWERWVARLNVANLSDRSPRNYTAANGGYDIAYDDPVGRYFMLSISTK